MEHSCCHGETLNQWLLLHSDPRIPPQNICRDTKDRNLVFAGVWNLGHCAGRNKCQPSMDWAPENSGEKPFHPLGKVMFPHFPHENSHEKNGAHPPCSETPPPILRVILSESLVLQTTTFEKKKKKHANFTKFQTTEVP